MNLWLTKGMRRFLEAIRDSEDEYAIQEGLAVYVDFDRFSAATVNRCLQLCLISEDQYSDGPATRIWILNEDGRKCLEDENYEPRIVAALSGPARSPKETV